MRELMNHFRDWNRDWELYYHNQSLPKPLSVENFINKLSKEFKIEKLNVEK